MCHWWFVEDLVQVGLEAPHVSAMQSQTKTEMAQVLAFGMVVKSEVVMLCVKQPMTARQKDRRRAVEVLDPAVLGVEWVVQVYSIATRE